MVACEEGKERSKDRESELDVKTKLKREWTRLETDPLPPRPFHKPPILDLSPQ